MSNSPERRSVYSSTDLRTRTTAGIRQWVGRSLPKPISAILRKALVYAGAGHRLVSRSFGDRAKEGVTEFSVPLPSGYPHSVIHIRLSIPKLPLWPQFAFSDHGCGEHGCSSDLVLATTTEGFAFSRDLGLTWNVRRIEDKRYREQQIVHLKSIGASEFLAQTIPEHWRPGAARRISNLVLNESGEVLAANSIEGSPWHGPRSADVAAGTLMYAEYPYEDPSAAPAQRAPSRVFRSRDRGRTWETVFTRSGTQVRHFHFLQARRGTSREWWLTAGDRTSESNIWVSRDDGDTWDDLTRGFPDPVTIDGQDLPRTVFRLTDLIWENDTVIWGTDDYLSRKGMSAPGSRVFRSPSAKLAPTVVGRAGWPIRNLVDLGEFCLVLTQGSARGDATTQERMPGVYLMPKRPIEGAPELVHLFDVEVHSSAKTGFTYSRASRAARNGSFFTFRASTDAFPFGHKILRWDVTFV